MHYYYLFFSFFIFGFLIQIFKFISVYKNQEKLKSIHVDVMLFHNSILEENKKFLSFKRNVNLVLFEYNKLIKKKFYITIDDSKYEALQYLLSNSNEFFYFYKTINSYAINLIKTVELIGTSFEYNLSYYDEQKKIEFLKIFNPILYLGNSLNFLVTSLFKESTFDFPKSLESILSIFSNLFTVIQFLFLFYRYIK